MLIDISEILSSKGKEITVSPELGLKDFRFGGVTYKVDECSAYELHISGGKSRIRISGHVDLQLSAPCSRCLDTVHISLSPEIDRSVDFDQVREGILEDINDICFMKEESLDTDVLVYNELIPHLPMKILCKEDCQGLCPVCGHNLNLGDCGCDRRSPDLQMSAIMDIFNSKQ